VENPVRQSQACCSILSLPSTAQLPWPPPSMAVENFELVLGSMDQLLKILLLNRVVTAGQNLDLWAQGLAGGAVLSRDQEQDHLSKPSCLQAQGFLPFQTSLTVLSLGGSSATPNACSSECWMRMMMVWRSPGPSPLVVRPTDAQQVIP